MQSGTSEKELPGRTSKRQNTDYHIAWLAFLKFSGSLPIIADRYYPTEQTDLLEHLRDAFDAGWDARGLSDLAITYRHRNAPPF